MAFGWGTNNPDLRNLATSTLATRYEQADISTRYYTGELHGGAFALPTYIAEYVETAR